MIQKNRFIFASLLIISVLSLFVIAQAQTTTPTPVISLPTITTPISATPGQTFATLAAEMTSNGGANVTLRGFNYGLNTNYSATTSDSSATSIPTGPFSKIIAGLTCSTVYHYRAFATNSKGTAVTPDQTFTTTACPTATPSPVATPTVAVPTASSIGETTVTLNGNITSIGGANVTVRGFDYGTSVSYGSTVSTSNTYGIGAFSQNVTGLTCSTTYHYRAFATNAGGTTNSSDQTFTTTACPTPTGTPSPTSTPIPTSTPTPTSVPAPSVSTVSVASITDVSAVMNGNITNTGGAGIQVTRRGFQYGINSYSDTVCEDGTFGTGAYSRGSNTTCGAITASVLQCGQSYQYRAFAITANGTGYGDMGTFNTTACPTSTPTPTSAVVIPTLAVPTASSIGETTATLNGNMTSTGSSNVTVIGFNYGTTNAYGSTASTFGTSYGTGAFSQDISGLICGTVYHYRAFATNTGGTSYSTPDQTFTTTACPTPTSTPEPTTIQDTPTLTELDVSTITATTAIVNANLSSTGNDTVTVRGFNYGVDFRMSSSSSQSSSSFATGNFTATLANLICNTQYTYQAFATNSQGTTFTSPSTFTTLACPTPTPTPTPIAPEVSLVATSSNIGRNSVTLTGSITSGTATERGFEYGLTNAYGTETKETDSYGVGQFTLNVTGLSPDRTYHFRAYAKNAGGTDYSNDYTFKTNPSPGNLYGWAWSANIGWVNLDTVAINQVNGDLIGYAWSNNIGWIKFGGLSGFPSGGSSSGNAGNANINLDTGEVTGWARACAGTVGGETAQYGANCSDMTSRTDGWDGWIELAGQNHVSLASAIQNKFWNRWMVNAQTSNRMEGLRMNLATGVVSGMAWGGPVIGWLNFNAGTTSTSIPFNSTCSSLKINPLKIRFTALPSGGDGIYEYAWDGSATYSPTPYFDKAYSGSGASSVSLSVREVGKNTVINPSCTYTQSDITIGSDPACFSDKPAVLVGEKINFTVNQPSPAGTYVYTWITGDKINPSSGTSRTYEYDYQLPGSYDLQVIVRNQTNGTAKTFSCNNINVSNKELKLFIGASQDDIANKPEASKKTYLTKVNNNFALKWTNTLDKVTASNPDGYRCEQTIDNVEDSWSSKWSDETDVENSGIFDEIALKVGTYKIGINCVSTLLQHKNDSVILKVISSTVKEI